MEYITKVLNHLYLMIDTETDRLDHKLQALDILDRALIHTDSNILTDELLNIIELITMDNIEESIMTLEIINNEI